MLQHQHPISHCQCNRPAAPAFADDHRDRRHRQDAHHRQTLTQRRCDATLLRPFTQIHPRRVDQRHDGQAEARRQLHHAHRLPVPLRQRLPVAPDRIAVPALVPDDHDSSARDLADARHDRWIIPIEPVTMEFDELRTDSTNQIERRRPIRMTCELHDIPRPRLRRIVRFGPTNDAPRSNLPLGFDEPQDQADRIPEPPPVDDLIDETMLEEKLRRMRPQWLMSSRFLYDAWPCKADERAWLGENDVALIRERRINPTRRRVRQHRDEGHVRIVRPFRCGGRLRHLHETEHALLHPGPAGCRDRDDRQPTLHGPLESQRDLFPDDRPHAAAEKTKIEYRQHDLVSTDAPDTSNDSLPQSCLFPCLQDALPVRQAIGEDKRVNRNKMPVEFLETPRIDQQANSLIG
ncbi:hypothetical protein HRbin27_01827 [bacterium HR27]|nr:hypothetical protein HRbin27_01827 [bacterium HR27]